MGLKFLSERTFRGFERTPTKTRKNEDNAIRGNYFGSFNLQLVRIHSPLWPNTWLQFWTSNWRFAETFGVFLRRSVFRQLVQSDLISQAWSSWWEINKISEKIAISWQEWTCKWKVCCTENQSPEIISKLQFNQWHFCTWWMKLHESCNVL